MADRPDGAAQAALSADVRRPVTFAFIDIDGEPLRVTDAPYSFTFAGTGDEDLDGFTFSAVDPRVVSVGEVKVQESGTETVKLTLSGLPGIDDELMTLIGDRSKWQGREARLWKAMLDPATLTRIGVIWSYYTGYMSVPEIAGDQTSQSIELDVEGFMSWYSQPSNRTYLDQRDYDPGDQSPEMSIAIANGASKNKG